MLTAKDSKVLSTEVKIAMLSTEDSMPTEDSKCCLLKIANAVY